MQLIGEMPDILIDRYFQNENMKLFKMRDALKAILHRRALLYCPLSWTVLCVGEYAGSFAFSNEFK